jgi:hypothetical protein
MKLADVLPVKSLHQPRTVISTAAPNVLWLPGGALGYAGTGAGVLTVGNLAGYALPDAVVASARGMVSLPPAWAGRATRLYVAWQTADANTGNVLFAAASLRRVRNGLASTLLETVSNTTVAAPGDAAVTTITAVDFAALPPDIGAGEFLSVAISRNGGAAGDTYANTVYLLALGLGLR